MACSLYSLPPACRQLSQQLLTLLSQCPAHTVQQLPRQLVVRAFCLVNILLSAACRQRPQQLLTMLSQCPAHTIQQLFPQLQAAAEAASSQAEVQQMQQLIVSVCQIHSISPDPSFFINAVATGGHGITLAEAEAARAAAKVPFLLLLQSLNDDAGRRMLMTHHHAVVGAFATAIKYKTCSKLTRTQ